MSYLILTAFFFVSSLIYFKVAAHFNIIDKPNERSSHTSLTIRGGGILFILAAIVTFFWGTDTFLLPAIGIIIIGTISFLDDIFTLPNKIRIVFHIAAVTLMFVYLQIFNVLPIYGIIALYVLVIGIINAYNFMDGINGITGLYSLVILAGLQFVNMKQVLFISPYLVWIPMIACAVFLFFNFRKKALCFAGDVGSVSIAFWIIILLLKLIFLTDNWIYLLFLSVYGVDTVLTIIHRLFLRQNIFKAHRMHFYQLLANERKLPHLVVTVIYCVIQATVIVYVITQFNSNRSLFFHFVVMLLPLIIIYISIKNKLSNIILVSKKG
ncbi:MraY family glycosyltransferase [Chitinophaga defluvii]|uniref:Glycosyltransferase family 4 protein n=1 Tax=Chitinophaga defluvii TaxID=3163343 RepID=A0ABV2T0N8_9BACT